jgi:glyoxylase-like metal-dependent hydrolase (beta-lactamase superfamily II)
MKHSKLFLLATLLLLGQILLSQDQQVFQITKLVNGIYELVADGGGYPVKVIASVGDDGVLMVDSGEQEQGNALVDALNAFDKGMPKIIINTHSHIEHLGGNITIGKSPRIIGHKNLRDRYVNGLYVFNGIPDTVLPNITFSDSMSVFFNGEEIRLIAFPGAHDNSDIIVWFTKSNIVCTSALCNGHHFPSVDGELGDILKYPETVAKVISILPEDVKLIPGHGDDCTMKEYRAFHNMLVQTSGIIRTELAKGKSLDELQDEDILADWKTWELYVDRNDWIQYWVKAIHNPRPVSTKMKVYAPVYHTILQSGADSAMTLYSNLKTMHSDQYEFEERTAMWIGRRLAYIDRNDDAVKFLNLCIKEYPNTEAAAISQYSLGNVYWNSGNKNLAKEPYKKYLERFAKDKTVLERLQELEKEK